MDGWPERRRMRFIDIFQNGEIRTKFYSQDPDLQLAIEELDYQLSELGFILTIKEVERNDSDYKLNIEISITN